MKVLMLGWEFPPFISGGLGTACYGLTKGLAELGTEVLFVLPRPVESSFSTHVTLLKSAGGCGTASPFSLSSEKLRNVKFRTLNVRMYPYGNPAKQAVPVGKVGIPASCSAMASRGLQETQSASAKSIIQPMGEGNASDGANYGQGLFSEIERYANLVCRIAGRENFDVIHAHDWMTYPAGVAAARATGRPLVAHIHSTEFDRSGEHVNQRIYDIERRGMHLADEVITVSRLTKRISTERYAVPEAKVHVIYNAVNGVGPNSERPRIKKNEKIVLFLGRITMQKGPECFLAAARKVLEKLEDVKFIMAGSGDMATRTIEQAADMGIGHKVLFTGFLRGDAIERVFRMADVYVMPSVSEPFGITPLEAMVNDVPVIISKQSGVAEILRNVLKVDFWDINEMANKIIGVLIRPPLQRTLRKNGAIEARIFSWRDSARRCVDIYKALTSRTVNLVTR